MRDYGKVSPQFWTGKTGKALRGKPELQIVALYLMTSPHSNMIGIYNLPLMYLAHETGLSEEGASKSLASLSEADFCTFEADSELVWVHEMAKYQIGENLEIKDKRCKGVANELAKVTSPSIKRAFALKYRNDFHLQVEPKKSKPHASPIEAPCKPGAGAGAETGAEGSTEPQSDSAPAVTIPLVDGTEYPIAQKQVDDWQQSFPAVDVLQELREMHAWSNANTSKRKTARGVGAFVVRWLGKEQDRGGNHLPRQSTAGAMMAGAI